MAIRKADEIFVIGYSFPQTDGDQETLVREAARQAKIKKLTVVNRYEKPEYFQRISDLFMVPTASVKTYNDGFQEFATRLR
jgi:hypothetical protein